jgi:hypothetical protein
MRNFPGSHDTWLLDVACSVFKTSQAPNWHRTSHQPPRNMLEIYGDTVPFLTPLLCVVIMILHDLTLHRHYMTLHMLLVGVSDL